MRDLAGLYSSTSVQEGGRVRGCTGSFAELDGTQRSDEPAVGSATRRRPYCSADTTTYCRALLRMIALASPQSSWRDIGCLCRTKRLPRSARGRPLATRLSRAEEEEDKRTVHHGRAAPTTSIRPLRQPRLFHIDRARHNSVVRLGAVFPDRIAHPCFSLGLMSGQSLC